MRVLLDSYIIESNFDPLPDDRVDLGCVICYMDQIKNLANREMDKSRPKSTDLL